MPQSNLVYPPQDSSQSPLEFFFVSPDPVEVLEKYDRNNKPYKIYRYQIQLLGYTTISLLNIQFAKDVIKQIESSRPGPQDLCKLVRREHIGKNRQVYHNLFLILPQETHPNYSEQEQAPPQPVASYNKPHNDNSITPSSATRSVGNVPKTTKLIESFTEKDASIQAGMILKILVPQSVEELAMLRDKDANAGDKLNAMNTIKSRAALLMRLHNELTKVALDVFYSPPEATHTPVVVAPLVFEQAPSPTIEDAPTYKLPYQQASPINIDDLPF